MGITASDVLNRAESARIVTVFCHDVELARHEVRAAAEDLAVVPTLVELEWEHAPALAHELDEIRDALAQAAGSLWPNWYITAEQRFERTRSPDLDLRTLLREVRKASPSPSAYWLREAWRRCRKGKLPLVDHLPAAEQVRQLSLALDPRRLVFALSVASSDTHIARVRGLARAAEWLAQESKAKTLLLVPVAWQGNQELDHVAYEAVNLHRDNAIVATAGQSGPPRIAGREDQRVQVLVGPVVGKPHPGSEVEQLLCSHLTADPDIGHLFEYNQRVGAFGEKFYIVDLVWRQGRLVVEVDGPEHQGHLRYLADRDRDYRFAMSGYTTLRVTNAEVCVDLERVVAKIRNMVSRLTTTSERKVAHDLRT